MIRPPSAKPWHMPCNFGTPNPKEALINALEGRRHCAA